MERHCFTQIAGGWPLQSVVPQFLYPLAFCQVESMGGMGERRGELGIHQLILSNPFSSLVLGSGYISGRDHFSSLDPGLQLSPRPVSGPQHHAWPFLHDCSSCLASKTTGPIRQLLSGSYTPWSQLPVPEVLDFNLLPLFLQPQGWEWLPAAAGFPHPLLGLAL